MQRFSFGSDCLFGIVSPRSSDEKWKDVSDQWLLSQIVMYLKKHVSIEHVFIMSGDKIFMKKITIWQNNPSIGAKQIYWHVIAMANQIPSLDPSRYGWNWASENIWNAKTCSILAKEKDYGSFMSKNTKKLLIEFKQALQMLASVL